MLTGKGLHQYLAHTVLDKPPEPERKPMRKGKRDTPRKGPERDPQYLAWIRKMPSTISGRTPRDD